MSSSERDAADRVSERATLPATLAENVEIEHLYALDGPRRIVGCATLVAHLCANLAWFIFTVERALRNTIRLSL